MKHLFTIITLIFILYPTEIIYSQQNNSADSSRYFSHDLLNDIKFFYTLDNLKIWSVALGGSTLFSFTPIDKTVKDFYQESIRGPRSDAVAKVVKPLGKWQYTLPLYAGCSLLDYFQWEGQSKTMHAIGNWGTRSSRSLFLGFPSMVLFQRAIGSDRPASDNSQWQLFANATGVSGHAFVGAIPFLAAESMTDNPWLKGIFITASTATAISRINDNMHYLSQAGLGWLIAWLSTRAVSRTENQATQKNVQVNFSGNRIDVSFTF